MRKTTTCLFKNLFYAFNKKFLQKIVFHLNIFKESWKIFIIKIINFII